MNGIDIITGCDSGMGRSLVQLYTVREENILTTYLDQNPFKDCPNVVAYQLDLTDNNSVNHFIRETENYIESHKLMIRTLFHNAAVGLGGTVENTPLEFYRKSMEVNFFSIISITQALLPKIIESNGRIIFHGSMGGRISLPFFSPYSSTKYALEALTDSLRREIAPLGVQVSILETGGVSTPIWQKVLDQDFSFIGKRYHYVMNRFLDIFITPGDKGVEQDVAAEKIYQLIKRKKLPHRYRISKNRLVNYLPLLLPSYILDRVIWRMLR